MPVSLFLTHGFWCISPLTLVFSNLHRFLCCFVLSGCVFCDVLCCPVLFSNVPQRKKSKSAALFWFIFISNCRWSATLHANEAIDILRFIFIYTIQNVVTGRRRGEDEGSWMKIASNTFSHLSSLKRYVHVFFFLTLNQSTLNDDHKV